MKNQIQTPKTEEEEKRRKGAVLGLSLKRKTLLLGVTFVLLIALIVAGTAAWYTRVSNVSGITMKVAEFDFNANFQSDDFLVNAASYSNVEDFEIAPGTIGCIPIDVSASGSGVNVDYKLALNFTDMADEFKQRIRFFYFADTNNDGVVEEITFNPSDASAGIEGTLNVHDADDAEHNEYIYWEWVYDLNPKCYYDINNKMWVINPDGTDNAAYRNAIGVGTTRYGIFIDSTKAAVDAHDAFDTKVGTHKFDQVFTSSGIDPTTNQPKVYTEKLTTMSSIVIEDGKPKDWKKETTTITAIQQAMEVRISITGGQARPTVISENPTNVGTSKYITPSSIQAH